jgi:uncharacterized protein
VAIGGGCANGDASESSLAATSAAAAVSSTAAATTLVPTTTTPTTTPPTTTPPTSATAPVQPEGFALGPAEVTLADGEVCQLCLWVAETSAQRQRGLMGVTDLGGADGMVFVYDRPASGQFWMRGTPMPLSIAFFAADGSFVSATDMEPCLTGPAAACPRYAAAGPYVAAIEVPQGRLAELGIGPGSRLVLATGPGCDDVGP